MKKATVAFAGFWWLFQIYACSQRPAPLSADGILGEPAAAGTPLPEEAGLPDFRGLFQRASPSVVNISAAHALPIPDDMLRGRDRAIWRALARCLGSGFSIDDQGHIVTCSSVIQDSEEIEVILSDGRHLDASVVAFDEVTNIAVLSLPLDGAPPPLPVAERGGLRVGDWVAAFGYPFGLSHSITTGIVSAVRTSDELQTSHGLILSDAAINPGCNGGPLLDIDGRVVGINLVPGRTEGSLGLAIPIHDLLPVIEALKQGRKPRHAWLGVSVQHVDIALANSFGLEQAEGALVSRVLPGGPAAKAGVIKGDIVISFASRPIEDPQALIDAVMSSAIGRPVRIHLFRKGKRQTVTVTPRVAP